MWEPKAPMGNPPMIYTQKPHIEYNYLPHTNAFGNNSIADFIDSFAIGIYIDHGNYSYTVCICHSYPSISESCIKY